MTQNGNFKRRVRARAAKTGESYTAARMHLSGGAPVDHAPQREALRLAVAQMTVREDPRSAAGLRASGQEMRDLMQQAHEIGARLIHFPEGATCFPSKRILSTTGPDQVGPADWDRLDWGVLREELEATRKRAGQLNLWTVFGSVHELTRPQRPHNSLYVISDRGEVTTRYDERLLSHTKISFMYTPGSVPITFEVGGFRFGCALGMESHFPEIFIEYEQLSVDCVLFSTTGGSSAYPNDAAFTAGTRGHAASNSYWVSYAVPSKPGGEAVSGIITPRGEWAAQCALNGTSSIAFFDMYDDRADPARPWRRSARSGIYESHQAEDDPRSDNRGGF